MATDRILEFKFKKKEAPGLNLSEVVKQLQITRKYRKTNAESNHKVHFQHPIKNIKN